MDGRSFGELEPFGKRYFVDIGPIKEETLDSARGLLEEEPLAVNCPVFEPHSIGHEFQCTAQMPDGEQEPFGWKVVSAEPGLAGVFQTTVPPLP